MDEHSTPNKRRKTVRFAEDAIVRTGNPQEDASVKTQLAAKDTRSKLLQHPQGLSTVLPSEDDEDFEGPSCNPQIQRLLKFRRDLSTLKEGEIVEGDLLDDITAAEENYEDLEYGQEEDGVPLEPFHLRQERQEGYFDADGAYIQYKLGQVKDAWLDSLAEMPGQSRHAGSMQDQGDDHDEEASNTLVQQEEPEALDDEDVAIYKRRIADILQPGETVLEALRRLGTPATAVASAPTGKRAEATAVAGGGQAAPSRGRKVPEQHREVFNRLTEYSSLLLDHGDYLIHSQAREEILRSIPIAAGPAAALPAAPFLQTSQPKAMDEDMDIFAGTPEPTAALQADSTSVSASQPAAEQPSLPPVRPDAASLDQLSLESSPERAAPGLQQHSHGMTSSGSNNDAGIMALRNNDDGNQQPKHHAGVSGGFWADLQNAEASSVQIENQSTMSSMAANERGRSEARPSSMQSAEPSASGAGDAPGDVPCATRDRIPDTEPMQTDAAGMVSESAAGPMNAGRILAGEAASAAASEAAPAATSNAAPASGNGATSQEMEGFAFDESSGLFYNSSLGYYFDPGSQLYGDAASGHWWKYHNGQYQLVS